MEEAKIVWAYLAGLIDGDGCISIGRAGPTTFLLRLAITNTNKGLLDWVVSNTRCGTVKHQSTMPGWKTCYQWYVDGWKSRSILEAILPYSVSKQEQIKVALSFLSLGRSHAPHKRAIIQQQMKWLNKKGEQIVI